MAAPQPSSSSAPAAAAAAGSASPSAVASGDAGAASGSGTPTGAGADAGSGTPSKDAPTSARSKSQSQTPAPSTTLPIRTEESFKKLELDRYITRDAIASAAMDTALKKTIELFNGQRNKRDDYRLVRGQFRASFPPSRLYGEGYSGYGNGRTETTGQPSRILYPVQKPRPKARQTPVIKYSRKDMAQQAEMHEELVPVRLDIDWDKVKLRDTFTWNLHERVIPVETFVMGLVEDMGLKPPLSQPVFDQVRQQVHEQLGDFYPPVFSEEDALDPELPYSAYKNDEMRILVKLNITIGQHTLVDQFEWEINNPLNSPEEFAQSMSRDLSLSGEFTTAIAHCIREQTQLFTKSLYSVGHPFDGRPVEDPDLVSSFLPSPLPTVFRPMQQAKEYAPYMYEMSEADLERNEIVFSREQRRQKRSVNRRGGPTLPDLKERQRTMRTLIVSSVLPGAATDVEDSRLYKRAAGVVSGRKGRLARDGDISDSEDSEDSAPDSPAMSQLQGTARTRGLRGAASAAQQRMSNIGRSETPEAITLHHHETRISSRRFGRDARDSAEEPNHYTVTLRVAPEKLKKLMRDMKAKQGTPVGSRTPSSTHQRAPSAAATSSMGPPTTPAASNNNNVPAKSGTPSVPQPQIGRLPAPPPPPDGQRGPPPVSESPTHAAFVQGDRECHIPPSLPSSSPLESSNKPLTPPTLSSPAPATRVARRLLAGACQVLPGRLIRGRHALLRRQRRDRAARAHARGPAHPRRHQIHVPAAHPLPRLRRQALHPRPGDERHQLRGPPSEPPAPREGRRTRRPRHRPRGLCRRRRWRGRWDSNTGGFVYGFLNGHLPSIFLCAICRATMEAMRPSTRSDAAMWRLGNTAPRLYFLYHRVGRRFRCLCNVEAPLYIEISFRLPQRPQETLEEI